MEMMSQERQQDSSDWSDWALLEYEGFQGLSRRAEQLERGTSPLLLLQGRVDKLEKEAAQGAFLHEVDNTHKMLDDVCQWVGGSGADGERGEDGAGSGGYSESPRVLGPMMWGLAPRSVRKPISESNAIMSISLLARR